MARTASLSLFLRLILSHLNVFTFLDRVGGESNPVDFFLLLADDIHSHQHIECIINTPPYVLLINLAEKERERERERERETDRQTDRERERENEWVTDAMAKKLTLEIEPFSSSKQFV